MENINNYKFIREEDPYFWEKLKGDTFYSDEKYTIRIARYHNRIYSFLALIKVKYTYENRSYENRYVVDFFKNEPFYCKEVVKNHEENNIEIKKFEEEIVDVRKIVLDLQHEDLGIKILKELNDVTPYLKIERTIKEELEYNLRFFPFINMIFMEPKLIPYLGRDVIQDIYNSILITSSIFYLSHQDIGDIFNISRNFDIFSYFGDNLDHDYNKYYSPTCSRTPEKYHNSIILDLQNKEVKASFEVLHYNVPLSEKLSKNLVRDVLLMLNARLGFRDFSVIPPDKFLNLINNSKFKITEEGFEIISDNLEIIGYKEDDEFKEVMLIEVKLSNFDIEEYPE